jgi:hypothetical protein
LESVHRELKTSGPKGKKTMGDWRRLRNKELHNMYASPKIIRVMKSRMMRWVRHVARMGNMRNTFKTLVGKPEGKRPFGKPRRRWEDNTGMDIREIV